ncbi:hypothetical protein [Streptomyces spectabilis]|uniref:Uncharacterized protein n=1 Tax=Streptomyces spectabilis TaxID=68270 RepID=A0A5P2X6E9_STRST|nr:hypothetical protein [Streptomyces spectabilis]MBB5108362.1 hypothetical protein [Streptomyces spectabilis]MCI3901119.1 hypothetical protein [Streptomyces spectabilis]QEV58610.1 hypothetical protein CP982_07665 [Streptomyces spectabilis]GGV46081.1 hypothetical protein GCM10010245_72240 [Streptomyces spectabilis]
MADFTTETITRTVHRWLISAAEPWGAAAAEIGKTWAAAERAYRQHHDIPQDQALHDDALRFHTRDDQIVIEYITETPTN